MIDGRNVDPALGVLQGEGAQQRVEELRMPLAERHPEGGPSYYGMPLLKESVWKWPIPLYFYVGGLAGASAALAASAQLRGEREVVRAGRWIALGGAALSAGLLIEDLGRPSRFIYMLRVFRPTSPMNLGTWLLTAFGGAATAAALLSCEAAGIAAGVLGLPLTGYTGVLLANTAVPLWKGARTTLPPLFVSSAAASAGSFFEMLGVAPRSARRTAIAGKALELAAGFALEREAASAARPLHRSTLWLGAKICTAAGLVLSLIPRKPRWASVAAGLLGTAGALAMRFAVFHAGQRSSLDPHATFAQQQVSAA